jgi:hypothetical protein
MEKLSSSVLGRVSQQKKVFWFFFQRTASLLLFSNTQTLSTPADHKN